MFTLKIDEYGDLIFDDNNSLEIVSGTEEVAQNIRVALGINKGEWFLNTELGLNYQVLMEKQPNLTLVRAEIINAVFQEPRVNDVEIDNLEFDSTKRFLKVNLSIEIDNGEMITMEEYLNG